MDLSLFVCLGILVEYNGFTENRVEIRAIRGRRIRYQLIVDIQVNNGVFLCFENRVISLRQGFGVFCWGVLGSVIEEKRGLKFAVYI